MVIHLQVDFQRNANTMGLSKHSCSFKRPEQPNTGLTNGMSLFYQWSIGGNLFENSHIFEIHVVA